MQKVSKNQFIQVIENNEDGLPDKDLAVKIGITPEHFCHLKKLYQNDIRDAARELTRRIALEQVQNLRRNAKKGDSQAAKYLLDMEKTLDLEVSIKEVQADIAKIKEIQAQQSEKAQLGLIRKAVSSDLGT